MPDRLAIKNMALAELPSAPIASEDENSLEARECSRWYDQALEWLLEQHDWEKANRRSVLAATANDRPSEYLYAYALPDGLGTPRRVIPDLESLGLGLPVPLPGEPYAETWAFALDNCPVEYIIENSVLYTNVENATLEYGAKTISEAVMSAMFAEALAYRLASHLAMPIKKDRELKADLIKQAEVAKDRAMADDLNRQPQSYGRGSYNEVAAARSG